MSYSKTLSQEQIDKLLIKFVSIFELKVSELSDDDASAINNWVREIVLMNIAVAMRPDNMLDITNRIFSTTVYRDFVLDLIFTFFTKGGSREELNALIANIAHGLEIDGPEPIASLINYDLKQSLPVSLFSQYQPKYWFVKLFQIFAGSPPASIESTLMNNKHLVIVFLIHLTNTLDK